MQKKRISEKKGLASANGTLNPKLKREQSKEP